MKESLSRQLLSGFGFCLILVGMTTLWINYRAVQNDLELQGRKRAQSIARSLEFATEGLLEFGNVQILQRTVQNFATLPAVLEVAVVNPNGETIASNITSDSAQSYEVLHPELKSAISEAAKTGIEISKETQIGDQSLIVHIVPFSSRLFSPQVSTEINPNQLGNGKRGFAVVIIDLQESEQDAWRIFLISTLIMISGTSAILILMLILLQKLVLLPLKQLNNAIAHSHQTGKINLPTQLPNNEIGFLAYTLEQAIAQLGHYEQLKNAELSAINAELENLSASLEQKVQERTQELHFANAQLEQANQLALAANQAKTTFFTNMSHELRTPLNAVLGFTQLILYDESTPIDLREQIKTIHRSAEHLLALINSVLEISKIEAGKQTLNYQGFKLHDLLQNVRELIIQKAEAKGLTVTFDSDLELTDPALTIISDELKLKQVLINLLNNAIKFTSTGSVSLHVSHSQNQDQKYLNFTIKDTGVGIEPENLHRIFEGFFQSETGKRSPEGTGLGLAITKNFIDLMGGEIKVESDIGNGSTFYFFIPIKTESTKCSSPEMPMLLIDPNIQLRKTNILLAEDNAVNQKLMVKMFSRLGHDIDVVENGLEVLKILRKQHYDIVFMDIQMPLMDGLTATIEIQKQFPLSDRPIIIALTANAMTEDQEICLAAGMSDYLTKPIDMITLGNILHKHRNTEL